MPNRVTKAGDIPEVETGAERIQQFPFHEAEIRFLAKTGVPLAAGARKIPAYTFEVKADGVDTLFVKRVEILRFLGGGREAVVTLALNYNQYHECELPQAFEIGEGGLLLLRHTGDFKVQIVEYVKKGEKK